MPAKTQTRKANKGKTKRTTRKATAGSKSALATPSVVKAATQTVSIAKAKGRPMLTWVGKRPLTQVVAFPAQHIETFDPASDAVRRKEIMWKDWPKAYPHGGLLFHGDNKEVLAHLLANGIRGKVNLIYIDPPFDSGADYIRKVTLRGAGGTAKLDGERYTLGEQIQYTDIWANDNYLQFMYERLTLLKELLADDGSIWLHCDPVKSHYLKLILDEVMGSEQFINEVVWRRSAPKGLTGNQFPDQHDSILFYCKDRNLHAWRKTRGDYSEEHLAKFRYTEESSGRKYMMDNLQNPNPNRPNLTYEWNGHLRCWRWTKERMQRMQDAGLIVYAKNGMPYLKRFLDEVEGPTVTDTWMDIAPVNSQAMERTNYPTQKPEELIDRILNTSSQIGDLVLDCFIGSGTTAVVAQKLGRRWIGCDINKGAVQTTSKRIQAIMREQITAREEIARQGQLIPMEKDNVVKPAQLSFAVYRVNDYDLQIQHNEAVNLACDHIGVTRSRTDVYFDGTLGKRLAKIIPFGHPLTLLDLEELKKELVARPNEDRDVVLVCLGKEIAVDAWLEDWNRIRKRGEVPNKIEVIELRTDPKYGKFFLHQPARGKVDIRRDGEKILVEIKDFISPTIIERLKGQSGILSPQIDGWRAMVDCVMIDSTYDGSFFNITFSDVPEKKSDLVAGKYELTAPEDKTTVAVKIIDMLGEELLLTKEV